MRAFSCKAVDSRESLLHALGASETHFIAGVDRNAHRPVCTIALRRLHFYGKRSSFPHKLSSRHCADLSATRVKRALHLDTSRTGMGARLNDFALHKPPAPDVEGVRRAGMCSCEMAVHRAGWKQLMPYCEN